MDRLISRLLVAPLFVFMGAALAQTDQPPPLAQIEAPLSGSLYVRMGGAHNVEAVVSDLLDHLSQDPRTRRAFNKVNLRRVKGFLSMKICDITGGGCKYSGDSMHEVHAGLGISEAEFYGMVDVLRDSLERHGVALRERNELLAILAPIKRDVVER